MKQKTFANNDNYGDFMEVEFGAFRISISNHQMWGVIRFSHTFCCLFLSLFLSVFWYSMPSQPLSNDAHWIVNMRVIYVHVVRMQVICTMLILSRGVIRTCWIRIYQVYDRFGWLPKWIVDVWFNFDIFIDINFCFIRICFTVIRIGLSVSILCDLNFRYFIEQNPPI